MKKQTRQNKKAKENVKEESMADFYDKWDAWGRRRTAWTEYVATIHQQKMETDDEYRKKQRGKHPMLYIGG